MLEELAFTGTWRRYQRLAIDAFERDRAAGRAGPTSSPRPARARRWSASSCCGASGAARSCSRPTARSRCSGRARCASSPRDARIAGTEPGFPITCLSYQSLAQLDDPEVALGRVAALRWATDRAAATGADLEEVEREVERFEGEAFDRRQRELRRITASVKKRDRARRARRRRARAAALGVGEGARAAAGRRRGRRDRARRVPPPRLAVGVRRARGGRRAGRATRT